jgi:hypothetical protein
MARKVAKAKTRILLVGNEIVAEYESEAVFNLGNRYQSRNALFVTSHLAIDSA